MYDALVKYQDSSLSNAEWYTNSAVEIEADVLKQYHDWVEEAMLEAQAKGEADSIEFYEGLFGAVTADIKQSENGWRELCVQAVESC